MYGLYADVCAGILWNTTRMKTFKVVQAVAAPVQAMCGVADYTAMLVQGFAEAGAAASLCRVDTWDWKGLRMLRQNVPDTSETMVHLQYPSIGMGKSPWVALVPWMFCKARVTVTLHEFAKFSFIRKLYMVPLVVGAKAVVVTNTAEHACLTRWFPWAKHKCHLIPIGSNTLPPKEIQRNPNDKGLVYFGQIAPGKGLEGFLDTVERVKAANPSTPCTLAGAVMDAQSPLTRRVEEMGKKGVLRLELNKPLAEVSKLLLQHTVAVLPFLDGITDKRGSAMACLNHGVLVVSTHTTETPLWLAQTTLAYENPAQAARLVQVVMKGTQNQPNPNVLKEGLEARTWGSIARRHTEIYGDMK